MTPQPTTVDLNALLKGDHDLTIRPQENADDRKARHRRELITHVAMIVMLFGVGILLAYLACTSTVPETQQLAVNGLVALVSSACAYVVGKKSS